MSKSPTTPSVSSLVKRFKVSRSMARRANTLHKSLAHAYSKMWVSITKDGTLTITGQCKSCGCPKCREQFCVLPRGWKTKVLMYLTHRTIPYPRNLHKSDLGA